MLNARALAAAALTPLAANAQNQINMPTGVSDAGVVITELGAEIYGLHMLIFWISVVIGVGVFGIMLYSIYAHRKSRGVKPSQFHEHTGVEIAWTVIPFFILVGMAVPATSTLLEVYDNDDAELSILVTGYQWKWHYDYLGEDVKFFSALDRASDETRQLQSGRDPNEVADYLLNVDKPLVVPEDTKVRLLLTAQDVIHAWWVPQFGMKKDAIPGVVNELWFKVDAGKTGIYRGQCAELCGRDHGFMPIVVKVVTKEEYKAWVAAQKTGGTNEAAPAAEAAPTVASVATTAPQG